MSLKTTFRIILGALLAAELVVAGAQPAYPNKPIKLLVGVPPGGSTDAITRMFADWLQESLGQPTVVDNRPGANTAVAADAVARSPADGHTLLVATEAFITVPLLNPKATFDPYKDFAPIGGIAIGRFVMAVHPSVPVQSLKELIDHAKARPGKLNYGSSGNAGGSHLGGEKFKLLTGANIVHIPYRGAGPALSDALGGQTQIALFTPLAVAAHIKVGKLKALAVTGPKRSPALPEVPTFAEAGLPQYEHHTWLSLLAPAGTPRSVVDMLNGEIRKMFESPRYKQRLEDAGVEPLLQTPAQLTDLMRKESAELAKLIKSAHIRMD